MTPKEKIDQFFECGYVITFEEQNKMDKLAKSIRRYSNKRIKWLARTMRNKIILIEDEEMIDGDIRWICYTCGHTYGTPFDGICTVHNGTCDVCKGNLPVTSGRKYRPYDMEKLKEVVHEG